MKNEKTPSLKGFAFQIIVCVVATSIFAYNYIDKINKLTEMRCIIPKKQKELKLVKEENTRLRYEIERFENPMHLMEYARKPEYKHLKYPKKDSVYYLKKKRKGNRR